MKHKVWLSDTSKYKYWIKGGVFHLFLCPCGQGDKWKLMDGPETERITEMDPEDFIAALLLDKIVPFDNNMKWIRPERR